MIVVVVVTIIHRQPISLLKLSCCADNHDHTLMSKDVVHADVFSGDDPDLWQVPRGHPNDVIRTIKDHKP